MASGLQTYSETSLLLEKMFVRLIVRIFKLAARLREIKEHWLDECLRRHPALGWFQAISHFVTMTFDSMVQ